MPELRKTKHILAYLEILPSTCNISDPENLTKVHQLYQKANIFIKSMMSVVPHPSFSVKIFANNLIFADEVAYHPDEDNEDLIKHSPERSLIALCYFVSYFQYQALLEYGWLIRGAVTCGSLYLTHTSSAQHIRQSGQNENSEVDFIWGGALVRAYTLQKEERYPRVIFDTEVSRYLEDTFPQQVRIFQSSIQDNGAEYPKFVHYAYTYYAMRSRQSAMNSNTQVLAKIQGLINECENSDLRRMYEWSYSYLNSVRETGIFTDWVQDPPGFPEPRVGDTPELEEYYIAYLDFLGTQNKILSEESTGDREGQERWLNAIADVYTQSLTYIRMYPNLASILFFSGNTFPRMQIKIFSDNVIVAIKVSDVTENGLCVSSQLGAFVAYFQAYSLLKYKWLMRGCITKGLFYIDDTFVWGPSMCRAEYLENSVAKNPRVLIDVESMDRDWDEAFIGTLYPAEDPEDGRWFVGYQQIIGLGADYVSTISQNSHMSGDGFLTVCRDILTGMFEEYQGSPVRDKVLWAIQYHNLVCSEDDLRINLDACVDSPDS